jgi:FixJ family two-component response regulator
MAEQARQTVAVVDDDSRIRESIESLLDSAGYNASLFRSAEEFLQSAEVAETTCLITDVRMPGIDGLELQRRVRLKRPRLPIIFISAHCDDEIRQRALDQGAIGFLYKPFDGADLLSTIGPALNQTDDF